MVDETKKAPTAEEIKQEEAEEQELAATHGEDKIRQDLIDSLGLDEEADSELLDKLVKEKIEDRKRFGKLVGQKRKWRETALIKPEVEKPKDKQPPIENEQDKPLTAAEFETRLAERDFQRELKDIDCSDELRKEVESFARIQKCSPKEAIKSQYISYLKEKEDKKAEEEEASAGGIRRTRPASIKNKKPEEFSGEGDMAKGFDLQTPEGRQAYEDFKKEHKLP